MGCGCSGSSPSVPLAAPLDAAQGGPRGKRAKDYYWNGPAKPEAASEPNGPTAKE